MCKPYLKKTYKPVISGFAPTEAIQTRFHLEDEKTSVFEGQGCQPGVV